MLSIDWLDELKKVAQEVHTDDETLRHYSQDRSIFEVKPKVVVFPRDSDELRALVTLVDKRKDEYPEISLTALEMVGAGNPLVLADLCCRLALAL